MPDGSLMQVKKKRKIPEAQVSFYVRQICLGLKYMHNENVIHRDIKPENIFLNDVLIRLCRHTQRLEISVALSLHKLIETRRSEVSLISVQNNSSSKATTKK